MASIDIFLLSMIPLINRAHLDLVVRKVSLETKEKGA